VLCGVGLGGFNAPNNRLMMVSTPHARSGGASGMVVMSRVLGQTTGATLVAIIFANLSVNATNIALFTASAAAVVGALLGSVRLIRSTSGTLT
jgi:DHA2 family multidrug resistance protein-like MFS transporter